MLVFLLSTINHWTFSQMDKSKVGLKSTNPNYAKSCPKNCFENSSREREREHKNCLQKILHKSIRERIQWNVKFKLVLKMAIHGFFSLLFDTFGTKTMFFIKCYWWPGSNRRPLGSEGITPSTKELHDMAFQPLLCFSMLLFASHLL